MRFVFRTTLTLIAFAILASCKSKAPDKPATAPQDSAFTALAGEYLEDIFRRQPTQATDLGIHTYDDQLENYSRQGVMDAIAAARRFRDRVNAIAPSGLSPDQQLDREQLLHAIDSRILTLAVVRPWAKDADSYSSGLTNTAYVMIKRRFAPPEERLRKLIAREKAMPGALLEARKNIEAPPKIYTQIAIEQIVDHATGGTHGDGAQHEDHHHRGARMRAAGDPHRPQDRPEQQPDADRPVQARQFDEIAEAA